MSRSLSRAEVLGWRDNWSHEDKQLIEHALDLLGEKDYYEPNTKQYVGARVGGRLALYVAPGYIYWPSPAWTEQLDPQMIPRGLAGGGENKERWYVLSTFRSRGSSSPKPTFEELKAPCGECFLVPSVTGTCGCD